MSLIKIECEVCVGDGAYPVINKWGRELYCITCPECYGAGETESEEADEPQYEYPPSTAARVATIEQMCVQVELWNK